MSKKTRQTRRQRIARNLRQRSRRALQVERLESRNLLNADMGVFYNESFPVDVDNNGIVSPLDALHVINELNALDAFSAGDTSSVMAQMEEGEGPVQQSNVHASGAILHFVDTNGDGVLSPIDALNVINTINAEGESGVVLRVFTRIFERPENYPFDGDGNRVRATNEITTIGTGQDFVVKIIVEDVRTMSARTGVFTAYYDFNFDPTIATLVESLPGVTHPQRPAPTPYLHNTEGFVFGNTAHPIPLGFVNGRGTGLIDTDNDGLFDQIDAIGSFAQLLVGQGAGETVLVEFAMTANSAGVLTISAEPTTDNLAVDPFDEGQSPFFDSGLFDISTPVCPSVAVAPACMGEMEFISDTITVVDRLTATPNGFVVNEDTTQTFDVLFNDINNTTGTLTITSVGPTSMGGTVVNNGDDLTYTPALNFNGTETFDYTIGNGLGDSSSATVTVTVAPVNDGPINSVPGSQITDEDTNLVINGLSVSDIDADEGTGLQVDLTVNNGTLTVGSSSASVTNDGTGNVRIDGSVADVNAALTGLTYSPNSNFNGADSLTINTNDKGNTGSPGPLSDLDVVDITIRPINDGPVNTVPGGQALFNTETLSFVAGTDVKLWTGPFSIADVDADTLEVTLTVGQGTLQFGAAGTPSNTVTASGSASSINSQLGTLIYDPIDTFIGDDTLTVTTSDLGNTGAAPAGQTNPLTDTDTVIISVAPPLVPFAAADSRTVEEDKVDSFNLSDLLANDLLPQGPTENTFVLDEINGMPPSTGTFATSNGTLTFDPGDGSFTYTPNANFFGADAFTYTISSTPNVADGPSIGTVNIEIQPINDGPINSFPGSLSIDEDNSLSFSGANLIGVEDIDAGTDGVTVTLSVSDGTLSVSTGGSGTVSNNDSGTVTLDGTVSEVNSALSGLTYTPDADFFGSDVLTINTNDNGNTGGAEGDPLVDNPLSDLATVNITIQSINDGPVLVVPGNQIFITDFDNILSASNGNALSVSDVDAGSDDVQLDLMIGQGSLTILDPTGLTVSGDGTNAVTLTGSVTALNAALGAGVKYETSLEGNRTLTATVNDLGNNGGIPGDPNASNPLSDSKDIAVEVLDFVPSDIAGFVYVDLDNSESMDAGEPRVQNVKITLTGTTFRNTPLSIETFTDRNGMYHFANLEPGNYDLQEHQPANLTSGTNSFASPVVLSGTDRATVTIPIAGGIDRRMNNFAERSLTSPFISMYDLTASQFMRSGALLGTNGMSRWTAFLGSGWVNYSNPRVDLMTMTLTVTDGNGTDHNVNLRMSDPNRHGRTYMDRVTSRTIGDDQVIRLRGSAADFGLPAEGEGEGEFADVQAANSSEMYAQAVDQVFGGMA